MTNQLLNPINKGRADLLEILRNPTTVTEDLLGLVENEEVDFKADPYDISGKGKFELCKDVSAFANHRGGLIIIGCDAPSQDSPTLSVDMVRAVNGLAKPLGSVKWEPKMEKIYISALEKFFAPSVSAQKEPLLKFHPITLASGEMLMVLDISRADPDQWPYIVEDQEQRITIEGEPVGSGRFNCFMRKGTDNMPIFDGTKDSGINKRFYPHLF